MTINDSRLVVDDCQLGHLSLNDLIVRSEAALAASDYVGAVQAMWQVVKRVPDDAMMRFRMGHCLYLAGDISLAERAYRQSIFSNPQLEAAYHGLVHILIERGAFHDAVAVAREQMSNCGASPDLQMRMLSLLTLAGRSRDALALVEELNAHEESLRLDTLRIEAELAHALGYTDQAQRAAYRAYVAFPGNGDAMLFFARYLCNSQRFVMAVPILNDVLEQAPEHLEARSLLTAALAEIGNLKDALRAGIPLIRQDPLQIRHWLFIANLAYALGYRDQSLKLLRAAAEPNPDSVEILHELARQLGEAGHFDEAIAIFDRLGQLAPGNSAIRDARIHYLNERQAVCGRSDGTTPANRTLKPLPKLTDRQRDRWARAGNPDLVGFAESLRIKGRVLLGLIMRDLGHKSAQSKLGIASTVIEPLIQIVFLGLVLSLFNHGRPPLGTNLFFFYSTGVLPFYLLLHVVNYNLNVFQDSQSLLLVPIINRLDILVATALSEFLIGAITTTMIYIGFTIFDLAPQIDHVVEAIFAYIATFLFAFGVSMILAVLNDLNKVTTRVWQSVQRVLYFASGVFYLPQMMPDWIREPLSWNPLLQCIEWFRTGFFPQYSPPWLDKSYLFGSAFALIVLGAVLQAALKRRLGQI